MAQPAGFMSQDNRTDMGIPVFWTTANSDPPWNFKIWLYQFLLAVTVKESVNPELLLEEPRETLFEPLPRPPRHQENRKTHKRLQKERLETNWRGTEFFWKKKKGELEDQRSVIMYIIKRYRKEWPLDYS